MIHVKLQLGCLLVILYIVISYIKETTKTKMKCDHFFDALMIVTPWAVFFRWIYSMDGQPYGYSPRHGEQDCAPAVLPSNGSDDHHYDRVYI